MMSTHGQETLAGVQDMRLIDRWLATQIRFCAEGSAHQAVRLVYSKQKLSIAFIIATTSCSMIHLRARVRVRVRLAGE
jgi:hypothetical protein